MDNADKIIDLYQRHARSWAADRGEQLFEGAWLDRFLALTPKNARVLDLGCGSGAPIANYLIAKGCMLTGVDSAPQMIAMCQQRFPDGDWRLDDMRKLSFRESFDGILAWDSFFHLSAEDQRAMFATFAEQAAPLAALMFTSGPKAGVAMGVYNGEPLYHASLDPDEYRALLAKHGFAVIAYRPEDPDCGQRTIWLAQKKLFRQSQINPKLL